MAKKHKWKKFKSFQIKHGKNKAVLLEFATGDRFVIAENISGDLIDIENGSKITDKPIRYLIIRHP